jgi:hypothetical protein
LRHHHRDEAGDGEEDLLPDHLPLHEEGVGDPAPALQREELVAEAAFERLGLHSLLSLGPFGVLASGVDKPRGEEMRVMA